MLGAIIILIFTALVGLILWWLDRRKSLAETPKIVDETEDSDSQCCGKHLICEKTSLAVMSTDIEYFDDEELDSFAGRPAESYSTDETDLFQEILLTMRPEEVPAWARSLQLRGINPPPAVREEILLIASELRNNEQNSSKM